MKHSYCRISSKTSVMLVQERRFTYYCAFTLTLTLKLIVTQSNTGTLTELQNSSECTVNVDYWAVTVVRCVIIETCQ